MNIISRATISIKRTLGKTVLLFLLITLIGTFLSLGSSVRQGIVRTELNLRERLPPVAAVEWEHRADGINGEFEFLTMDMIEAIADLPYVRDYDLRSTVSLVLQNLNPVIPELDVSNMDTDALHDYNAQLEYGISEIAFVVGVNNPQPFDLQAGVIELSEGRFMTDTELEEGRAVAVVSTAFAEENNLGLYDSFSLEHHVHNMIPFVERMEFEVAEYGYVRYPGFKEDELFYRRELDFEIIGIFEINHDVIPALGGRGLYTLINLYNQVYVPHRFLEALHIDSLPYMMQSHEASDSIWDDLMPFTLTQEQPVHLAAAFLLYDPRDFTALETAAREVLPPDWFVIDASTSFVPFLASMDSMLWIADLIFWTAVVATIVALSLTVILFLKDRKQEIGIYLALGEKKKRVFFQLLVEVMAVTIVGLSVSLFLGHLLANQLSHGLLEQEIIHQMKENNSDFQHWDLILFVPEDLSIEEMMEAYSVNFTMRQTGIFLVTGGVTILISASIPILYTLRINTKDILMQGRIA